jgi:hypothetical protein
LHRKRRRRVLAGWRSGLERPFASRSGKHESASARSGAIAKADADQFASSVLAKSRSLRPSKKAAVLVVIRGTGFCHLEAAFCGGISGAGSEVETPEGKMIPINKWKKAK